MNIFPTYSEVLVSPYSSEEVSKKLQAVTKKVNYLDGPHNLNKSYQFNGEVNKRRFSLSLIINRADSFLPLIKGEIEPVKNGCILFLRYSLFPSSIFFLAFWGLITFLLGAFFVFIENLWVYGVASILAGLANFLFAWFYFNSKLKQSQMIFHQMLSLQEKD